MMSDTRTSGGASVAEDYSLAARVRFALTNFLVCLLAALWLFNRKAY